MQLLELFSMDTFYAQYDNFENRLVTLKPLPVEQTQGQF